MRSPTTAKLTNPNFQYFCELGTLKYRIRPTFKNAAFESMDKLSSTVEYKSNLHIISLVTIQT